MDGTLNTEGSILEVAELLLCYNEHSERAHFCVTRLGRQNLILGHTWLTEHNLEVDWRTGKVKMSRSTVHCGAATMSNRSQGKKADAEVRSA
jgi:hypothetical protein